ncbi:MAG TPA: hypothetical protein VL051_05355 [Burkholderiaceae bacterium]|nr:hypothetical protein [Burkholderiaceae bacterium]
MLQKTMAILWPSFLAAIIAEGCFFSLFVPGELPVAYEGLELTAAAIYSIGFFCFWALTTLSSLLTWYLMTTPAEG